MYRKDFFSFYMAGLGNRVTTSVWRFAMISEFFEIKISSTFYWLVIQKLLQLPLAQGGKNAYWFFARFFFFFCSPHSNGTYPVCVCTLCARKTDNRVRFGLIRTREISRLTSVQRLFPIPLRVSYGRRDYP